MRWDKLNLILEMEPAECHLSISKTNDMFAASSFEPAQFGWIWATEYNLPNWCSGGSASNISNKCLSRNASYFCLLWYHVETFCETVVLHPICLMIVLSKPRLEILRGWVDHSPRLSVNIETMKALRGRQSWKSTTETVSAASDLNSGRVQLLLVIVS